MASAVGPEATVREFVACINRHDASAIAGLCTADHAFIDSLGSRLTGRDMLEGGWRGYFSLFPDYVVEIETMASTGALVLACGWASATHAPSGAAWRIPAAWRARIDDGRVAEWQVFADNKPVYEIFAAAS
jgi:ketosteroid isomerase-like protein